MQQRILTAKSSPLSELLGTYLQLSARFNPPAYSLRTVAKAVSELDSQQSTHRSMKSREPLPNDEEPIGKS